MARRAFTLTATAACLGIALVACGAEPTNDDAARSTSSTTIAAEDRAGSTVVPTSSTTLPVPELPGQVLIRDYELLPPTITIAAGGTVTWQNSDDVDHWMITDDTTTVDSGAIAAGEAYVATLATPGTFGYYCDIHNAMKGTIVVE